MSYRTVRVVAIMVAAVAPILGLLAPSFGQGYGAAAALTGVQAVAVGVLLWGGAAQARWVGPAFAGVVLVGLAAGAAWSAEVARLVAAGLAHACLYGGLLAWFGRSLRPGRTSVVTTLARRMNPRFHAGMIPYTRAVTLAWCGFFAGQLAVSVALLAAAPGAWQTLVTVVHSPAVLVMAAGEYAVRRWRWRHERYPSLRETAATWRRTG